MCVKLSIVTLAVLGAAAAGSDCGNDRTFADVPIAPHGNALSHEEELSASWKWIRSTVIAHETLRAPLSQWQRRAHEEQGRQRHPLPPSPLESTALTKYAGRNDALEGSRPRAKMRWIRGGASQIRRAALNKNEQDQRHRRPSRSILLYYPNLIGYARILLVMTSYYLAEVDWKASSCFYVVAFVGDAVDGRVARKFDQASRFGSVLDMVTDRCATAGLLLVLSRLYGRRHAFAFLVFMYIDLFSHWMHTHSVEGRHHKARESLRMRNVLIRTYYDNILFFGFCCVGAELFYVCLYLLHFLREDHRFFRLLHAVSYWICLPACVLKQLVNIAQMIAAAKTLAAEDGNR